MPRALLPLPLVIMATVLLLAVGTALAVTLPSDILDTNELSGALSKAMPTQRGHPGKDRRKVEFPKFYYYLDESDPDILMLRRQDGTFVAAFSAQGATREGIVEAAKEDYRNLLERMPEGDDEANDP
jgi:hypothetical protein